MLDIKLPEGLPFRKTMLLSLVWGMATGASLGIVAFGLTLLAFKLDILPIH